MTHQTTYCTRGHRVCLCPQACDTPEHCAAWAPGASTSSSPITSTRATATHLAVTAAAVLALVLIVKTAAGA